MAAEALNGFIRDNVTYQYSDLDEYHNVTIANEIGLIVVIALQVLAILAIGLGVTAGLTIGCIKLMQASPILGKIAVISGGSLSLAFLFQQLTR